MNIWEIVKTVGPRVLDVVLPGAGVALNLVNSFLPDDKQLPVTATGDQLGHAMESLTSADRAQIEMKQFDVEIVEIQETHETARAMLVADATNPQSTRPKIAWYAFIVVAILSITVIALWAYAVAIRDAKLVTAVTDGWPFVVAVILPFVGWLNRYFGIIKQEQKQKLDAANGASPVSGLAGIISAFKGK